MTNLIMASRNVAQFNLRLPDDVRDRIKADADANGRSMNAEVLYRLQTWAKPGEGQVVDGVDTSQAREALALVKQLEAAANSAFDACQRLGINLNRT